MKGVLAQVKVAQSVVNPVNESSVKRSMNEVKGFIAGIAVGVILTLLWRAL